MFFSLYGELVRMVNRFSLANLGSFEVHIERVRDGERQSHHLRREADIWIEIPEVLS